MKETKFKQTEVGMIPSDWEVKFLSEIGSFSKGSGISRSESNSGNLPAIRYGEIYTKHNDYIKAFYSHISKEVANKSTRIYRGDVLFSASGETKEDIGKTVAFLESIEAYAGGDIIIMSPKCPVNSMFLGYILNFPAIAKQKAMKAQGDAVVHITTDSLRKLQVCIPKTTKEQQRIANALSDIDTLIANLEKLIAKKKNIKQGAMQQLLTGKKRLPGFAPAKPTYKQTELGKIPADWEVKKLKECVSSFIVPMRDKPTLLNGPIPWCRIEDFDGTYLYGSKSNQGVDLDTVKKMNLKIYPVGTLIVSCSAYLGKCAIVGKELITNQTFIGLVPMKQTDVSFLYYRMTSEEKRLNDMATGTTITYLSREQFE
ncbi:MAG: restriction endonuclease subunit S, partial [Fibrobacter sp.]|nr:restriction endonuclease subunit S [Fibrobacter sp.]